MAQMQPTTLDAPRPLAGARARAVAGRRLPRAAAGSCSCSRNPKCAARARHRRRHGAVALIAPLIAVERPERLQPARRAAGAVVAPPVRHDRPGHRHLLAGRARGARRSLMLGAAAARARDGARGRRSASSPRTSGGSIDDVINFVTNVFLVIPTIPLLVVRLRVPEDPRHGDDDHRDRAHALGVRGAHPARPGAVAAEPRLHPRREGRGRVDAAHRLRRADAEHDQPDRRRVRARLLHRAPRRRRPRVPRPRRHERDELGRDALLGAGRTRPSCRASGGRSSSPASRSRSRSSGSCSCSPGSTR